MSLSKSRERSYRYRVKCEECEKEFDSDYVEAHSRIVHSGGKLSEMSANGRIVTAEIKWCLL